MPDDFGPGFRIRPARAADARQLSMVAFEAKAFWGDDLAWMEAWRPQLTLTAADLDRMIVRVAEQAETIVGFGAVGRLRDEWELAHLWVKPDYMRRGIGRRLLDALALAARQAGANSLRIESDPRAEAFYLGAGAARTGVIPAPMPGAPMRVLPVLQLALE